MISIIPEGFNDFACKGGSCRHTCCQVWEIDIDEDTAEYYRQLPGKLGTTCAGPWSGKTAPGISG